MTCQVLGLPAPTGRTEPQARRVPASVDGPGRVAQDFLTLWAPASGTLEQHVRLGWARLAPGPGPAHWPARSVKGSADHPPSRTPLQTGGGKAQGGSRHAASRRSKYSCRSGYDPNGGGRVEPPATASLSSLCRADGTPASRSSATPRRCENKKNNILSPVSSCHVPPAALHSC